MTRKPVREARCQCCGGYAGHGADPEYCRTCIKGGEPPEEWTSPAEMLAQQRAEEDEVGWSRPNLLKLRGYEFEEVVPWKALIEKMRARGEQS